MDIIEETVQSKRSRDVPNSGKPEHIELPRRTVLNPFKKVVVEKDLPLPVRKHKKSTEEIFQQMSANPKTVKQRQQNAKALVEYNENHEDDIFGEPVTSKAKLPLLKPSNKKTLLSQDSDSDSEQDISVHSVRTPIASYFGKRGSRTTTPMLNHDRTPGILIQDSPLIAVNGGGFQAQAYIHKKVAEKANDSRKLKRRKFATALVSKFVSRSQADRMVDQSSQVINTVTNHTANIQEGGEDEENDQVDDWFDDDQEAIDPGVDLLEQLTLQSRNCTE
eukprot:GFUD01040108.1.p2 GENE.GFUD01040108.1~~GFUD01040108.1.p2  ORF type:complete len:277 (+),score=65.25 GFUD01040108.1:1051-1881(+)